jgi:hypothetical protein
MADVLARIAFLLGMVVVWFICVGAFMLIVRAIWELNYFNGKSGTWWWKLIDRLLFGGTNG